KAGEKVGLVGVSGAGKSTLVHLLLRLYDLDKGEITIDGENIADVQQDTLRAQIAMVAQDNSLFHRTLSENIKYGKPNATQKEVERAAKLAHAHAFITDMEKGYRSKVGERGIKLSGGQRQRIAIARAFLKDAPILILDEATSALDTETEKVIQESLMTLMRGRTTIAIAHRLSTLLEMDRIIVLDKGKILETGSHKELIKKKTGTYARLWAMQSGGFLPE
ncbi:MAG: ATP-binding cassette domain-containing protein, partial [Alphaproteobacteria bacterium]|nr:ATP-binding cassette domain-containing protein [Alphaproteobacteria bacterium]